MRLFSSLSIPFCLFLGNATSFQLPRGSGWGRQHLVVGSKVNGSVRQHPKLLLLTTTLAATAAEPPPSSSAEPWTKPRLHNKPLVRSAVLLAALVLTGLSSPFGSLGTTTLASIHLLSFGTWFGTVFYTTFIAGLTMFKALPRQTFGKLQSKLFPKYFALSSITIVLQLITVKRLRSISAASSRALGVAFFMTLLNQFFLEPRCTSVMFERYEMENSTNPEVSMETDEYKKLRAQFGKLHGVSSLTNLVAFIGAVVHGVLLSTALVSGAAA